jgi:uncharacterized protein (TIRG00374 family)
MNGLMGKLIQLAVSLLFSGLFIWLSLKGTDPGEVWATMRGAQLHWIALSLVTLGLIQVLRAERWRRLVGPVATLSFSEANRLSAVGVMALNVLPLRLGEFARPLLLARHARISRASALAGVVVERVIDGLSMGLVLAGLLWSLGDGLARPDDALRWRAASFVVAGAFLVLTGLLAAAVTHEALARLWLAAVVTRRAPGLGKRLEEFRAAFTEGLGGAPEARLRVLLLTVAYWWASALGQLLLARAFGLELTWLQAWTVLGLQVLGAFIPAAPASLGTFQYFTKAGVLLFFAGPLVDERATAFAYTSWLVGFVQQVGLGLWYVARGEVRMPSLWSGVRTAPSADAPSGS